MVLMQAITEEAVFEQFMFPGMIALLGLLVGLVLFSVIYTLKEEGIFQKGTLKNKIHEWNADLKEGGGNLFRSLRSRFHRLKERYTEWYNNKIDEP